MFRGIVMNECLWMRNCNWFWIIYCILDWFEMNWNWESVKYSFGVFDCVEFGNFFCYREVEWIEYIWVM